MCCMALATNRFTSNNDLGLTACWKACLHHGLHTVFARGASKKQLALIAVCLKASTANMWDPSWLKAVLLLWFLFGLPGGHSRTKSCGWGCNFGFGWNKFSARNSRRAVHCKCFACCWSYSNSCTNQSNSSSTVWFWYALHMMAGNQKSPTLKLLICLWKE